MTSRFFADLSENNRSFNARDYKRAGHLLVMLKATEGTSFKDRTYRARRHEAHDAGLAVIHYHFARPDIHTNGTPEAEAFAHFVFGGVGKHDGFVIDVERGTNTQASQSYLTEFEDQLAKFYPHIPLILYRSKANHRNICTRSNRNHIADYSGKKDNPQKVSPEWAHQFTDGQIGAQPHSCAGIGNCDVSRLNLQSYNRLKRVLSAK